MLIEAQPEVSSKSDGSKRFDPEGRLRIRSVQYRQERAQALAQAEEIREAHFSGLIEGVKVGLPSPENARVEAVGNTVIMVIMGGGAVGIGLLVVAKHALHLW